MKIVLINPKPKIWIKSVSIPLGIAYIAAVLEKNGYNVKVVDLNLNVRKEIPDADIYGFSVTTPLINEAFKLAQTLKKPNNFIVFGGPHPTCLPDESLENRYVDFVIRGEGEYSMLKLVQTIDAQSKKFDLIKGLSYKDNDKIIHNENSEFIQDLDALPFPAYHLFRDDIDKYTPQPLIGVRKRIVNMLTSRGCPFDCFFCYKGTFGRKWRTRSPENIVAEWQYLIEEFKVKEISVQDDCFNTDKNRCIKFADMIVKKNLQLPWTLTNGIRADLTDDELIAKLKAAGLYRAALGIESGNQIVLNDIGKNLQLSDVERSMKILQKYKIQTIALFVMGNFLDTEKTLQESIDYAIKLNPTFAQFTMATPFPGTRLFKRVKELNTFRVKNWDDYSQFNQIGYFDYPQIKGETIAHYVNKAYRDFYFRPRFIYNVMKLRLFYINLPSYISGVTHFMFKGK
ncbi:cobalamin B12-binding domain-containing protein [Candidatus Poribacteria bacterium]|nr:cobalamin B12-binding domain-containing protein [Candidatus Poribacteria bacterium]